MRLVFVTVGTTRFDELVRAVLDPEVGRLLAQQGYDRLLVQSGHSDWDAAAATSYPIEVERYDFKTSLVSDVARADLVISHAGAGTCLEVQAAKKPQLVVVNDRLMGNHQQELADKLVEGGHCLQCTCANLKDVLKELPGKKLTPLPPGDPQAFVRFLDEFVSDIYQPDQ